VQSNGMPQDAAQVPVNNLDQLAGAIRDAHVAVGHAARNVLEHAMAAGDALHAAKKQVKHGQWLAWLKRQCDLSDRQAERYMTLAAARQELTANSTRVSDLSLRGALQLLKSPPKPEASAAPLKPPSKPPPSKPPSSAKLKWSGRHDATAWWMQASLEERQRFVDGIGRKQWLEAIPPSWRERITEPPPAIINGIATPIANKAPLAPKRLRHRAPEVAHA
jgi:Protein of unknown function (DUF3102)